MTCVFLSVKKASINFHYTDKEDVSLVPDLTRTISLSITDGDPVIELKKNEITITKTTDYDFNTVVAFNGSYSGLGILSIDKGNFDKNQVGQYEIEYKYTDINGKTVSQTLKVNVVEQKTYY